MKSVEVDLHARSGSKCELCSSPENPGIYEIPPDSDGLVNRCILICNTCRGQVDETTGMDINHWRCLNESMWNTEPAVQVMAWRLLTRMSSEGWPQDLLDMLYLDDETLAWAKAGGEGQPEDTGVRHVDSNGARLEAGDSVTLIKDLNVKGAGFTAKRGTAVRSISLVRDNPEHIEGRVNGQQIVILTRFVKKSN
jgi:protein PhnA